MRYKYNVKKRKQTLLRWTLLFGFIVVFIFILQIFILPLVFSGQ